MKKVFLLVGCMLCLSAFSFASATSFSDTLQFPSGENKTAYYLATNGYYFLVSSDSGIRTVYFISSSPNVTFTYNLVDSSNPDNVTTTPHSRVADTSTGNGYYYGIGGRGVSASATTVPSLTAFSSASDAFAAFDSALPNLPPPGSGGGVTPGPNDRLSSFTLPRGNVAYFKVSVASDVNMTSHMPTLNNLVQFGNNSLGPWGDTGQRWGAASALPDSSTTFPLGSQVPLTWTKDSSQNILGQTKIGHASKACTTGQWYVFFNPGVSGLSANGMNDIAGASVDFTGYFSELIVFPLSERLDYSNPLGGTFESYSDDGYASYFDGTINDNGTVTWENQDGELSSPAIGGQNAQYGDLSTEGLIKRVQEYLANILNEIKSLFTFGYEAIQSLVDIMSDFVNVFQGLYSWLPQPVHAALISAVSVAVVIGVFKVFL